MESSGAKENQEGQRRSRSVSNGMVLVFNTAHGPGSYSVALRLSSYCEFHSSFL